VKTTTHQVEYRAISELNELEGNPRTIKKDDFERLKKSLQDNQDYFEARPIILSDRTGKLVIIAGNQRYKAAKAIGLTEVPTVLLSGLSEEREKEIVIRDNVENGEWDMDILANEWDTTDLKEWGAEINWEAPAMDVVEDDFTEPDDSDLIVIKPGEIYQCGNHRIMCGDSTCKEDVDRLMGGVLADMVFTDPPYNVAIGDKNKALNALTGSKSIERNLEGDVFKNDEEAGQKLWLPAFKNMYDNAEDTCAIYVTMPQGGTHMMMMMMMAESGWKVKHELIWVKNSPTFSMGRLDYDYQHEPICFGWKKNHKKIGKGKFTKSVWEIDKPRKDGDHPTMKPIELVANAIENSSELGDKIMDLFGGSGSTLIACEQTGRKCFMMELDPHYVAVILKRWEDFTGRKAEKVAQ
jgi:site-specific DNA-methyltransferase (adenine-specific)